MQLVWIQDVVIMEADLTMKLREWYLKASKQFGWSKTELIAGIAANAHEVLVLAVDGIAQNLENEDEVVECAIKPLLLISFM